MKTHRVLRAFAVVTALLGWFAVLLQFYLSLRMAVFNGRGVGWGVFVYFGYFTVLTNILATIAVTAPLTFPNSAPGRFFTRPGMITAIATAISIVGIVYSLLLRQLWDPEGFQRIADGIMHDIMPILFLAYWWFAVPKGSIRWSNIPRWLLYPLGYFLYTLVRGAIAASYPYPFVDVGKLSYGQVLVNAIGMLLGFTLVASILVGINGLKKKPIPIKRNDEYP
jgi:hypothetical protein